MYIKSHMSVKTFNEQFGCTLGSATYFSDCYSFDIADETLTVAEAVDCGFNDIFIGKQIMTLNISENKEHAEMLCFCFS